MLNLDRMSGPSPLLSRDELIAPDRQKQQREDCGPCERHLQPVAHRQSPRDQRAQHQRERHGEPQYLRTDAHRSEEHTSELQSLMRTSYAVFCFKKKKTYKSTKY